MALALLFQDHFQTDPPSPAETLSLYTEEAPTFLIEEASHLRNKIKEKDKELEATIEKYSKWRKERTDLIDRTILKIALYEMLYEPSVPPAVAINEAIELSKRFSSGKAYQFINGLLDKVKKEQLNHHGAA